MVVITSVVLIPIAVIMVLAGRPRLGTSYDYPFGNVVFVLAQNQTLVWIENSLLATLVTVAAAVVVATPAGYAISRARGRLAAGYSVLLFALQSVPVVTTVIPMFFLFARSDLIDTLGGVILIFIGSIVAVTTWMMTAYFDTIPVAQDDSARVDGAGRFGAFARVVLPNALPGVLSIAVFAFIFAWNDFLIGVIMLRSVENYTAAVGLRSVFDEGSQMGLAAVLMVPPAIVFALLHRHFSIGGLTGSFAGR